MKYTYILIVLLAFTACDNQSTYEQIKAMEQSDAMGTDEGLAQLATLHKEYGLANADSLGNTYLYAAATYYFYEKELEESKSLFETYLERGDSGTRLKNTCFMLAEVYADEEAYESMDKMLNKALNVGGPNNMQWNNMVKLYNNKISISNSTPNDYERLAMGYQALGKTEMALNMLDTAIAKFPENKTRANLMFRAGFVAWEHLDDPAKAKHYYELFLEAYPDHELAGEVKSILDSGMLEMTDEDILDMLKDKNNS